MATAVNIKAFLMQEQEFSPVKLIIWAGEGHCLFKPFHIVLERSWMVLYFGEGGVECFFFLLGGGGGGGGKLYYYEEGLGGGRVDRFGGKFPLHPPPPPPPPPD